jgi:hypothetical protein
MPALVPAVAAAAVALQLRHKGRLQRLPLLLLQEIPW